MLDIPTAQANRQKRRTAAAETTAATPAAIAPQSTAVPGATSLAEAPPTALSQTTPYEYAGQGWNDPIAQDVMQKYYAGKPGNTYNQLMGMTGSAPNTQYNSPLSPESWGSVYKGADFDKIAEDYKAAGGTYYNQFTPAQLAGVPYVTATGEPAPVYNAATGLSEIPTLSATGQVLGQTPAAGASGSSFSLNPNIINKMWR